MWDLTLQQQFKKIKEILKSPLGLKPFNKSWDTILYTDYSSKGVGYALTQENPDDRSQKQLIYCGSSSLSEKQRRFPAIYGKNLAIITGLEKCRYWLRGCPHFTIRTDQKALEAIYNSKPLDDISDKISDIVVSTYRYNFSVKYIQGKHNELADYLSQNPEWDEETEKHGPWITDDFGKEVTIEAHICSAQTISRFQSRIDNDPLLESLRDSGAIDDQHSVVIRAIQDKKNKAWVLNSSDNPCRE